MTVLQRTDLTTSQKIQCAAAAVAGQHAHGSKTALSETYEISRPTVYAVGAAAESVLRSHFEWDWSSCFTNCCAGQGLEGVRREAVGPYS